MTGKTLGHYRILERIGQGGMGVVFLAEDTSLHRKVALKFLPPDMQQDDTARKRFIREARSAAALDHPYICHINEVGESEGQDFIAMEYVEGQSLNDRIAAETTGRPPVPLQEALQIAIEVAEALEAAHGKGIIHRDIKPGNIMLTETGHAKVMDFGLAKQTMASGGVDVEEATVNGADSERGGHRDAGLHVAGAVARAAGRCAQRPVGVGGDAVRDGRRDETVPGTGRV